MKKNKPKMAFCYDFDGTLSPGNMQEYDFIQKLNMPVREFWQKAYQLSQEHDCDEVLSYMRLMLQEAEERNIPFTRQDFRASGAKITFYEGIDTWFDRVNAYAAEKGIEAEHYIISSGLREIIKGTSIAHAFKWIYASSFMYDESGKALWPAMVVNYTTKTQYLFRINKGCLKINDPQINAFTPDEDRIIPFSRMVYVGDGETDIPCMKLVKSEGGHSIAVYEPEKERLNGTARKLLKDGRVDFIAPAVFTPHSMMEELIKTTIDKVAIDLKMNRLRQVSPCIID